MLQVLYWGIAFRFQGNSTAKSLAKPPLQVTRPQALQANIAAWGASTTKRLGLIRSLQLSIGKSLKKSVAILKNTQNRHCNLAMLSHGRKHHLIGKRRCWMQKYHVGFLLYKSAGVQNKKTLSGLHACITLHSITVHYITLHCCTLQYDNDITLCGITLHYIWVKSAQL